MKAPYLVTLLHSILMIHLLSHFLVRAEYESILKNAQVSTHHTDTAWTGDPNSVISAGFKSLIMASNKDPKGDGSGDSEF